MAASATVELLIYRATRRAPTSTFGGLCAWAPFHFFLPVSPEWTGTYVWRYVFSLPTHEFLRSFHPPHLSVRHPVFGEQPCPFAPQCQASAKSAVSSSTKSAKSSSSAVPSVPSVVTDKVLCVCGVTVDDGKPMVECGECGSWSHIQCSRLTLRTAKKVTFRCHRCKPSLSSTRNPGRDGMGSGSTKLGKTQKSKNSQAQVHAQPIQSHSCTLRSLSPVPPPSQPTIVSSQPHSTPPIHQMNRNLSSDACITAECDVIVMEDSGTHTSTDPHSPIVPSSASVHVQHGAHVADNVLGSELNNIISKLKSEIRMETQVRMLSLEAQVAELKQSVNNLTKKCRELSQQAQPTSKASTQSHSVRSSNNESTRRHTNTLPFRVVWGTSRSCSSVVIQKALCALLPRDTWGSVSVKGSFRRRGSRHMWWHTIMAPDEVMRQIESVWHSLEGKTSWSLRTSLSNHSRSPGMEAEFSDASSRTCPLIPPSNINTITNERLEQGGNTPTANSNSSAPNTASDMVSAPEFTALSAEVSAQSVSPALQENVPPIVASGSCSSSLSSCSNSVSIEGYGQSSDSPTAASSSHSTISSNASLVPAAVLNTADSVAPNSVTFLDQTHSPAPSQETFLVVGPVGGP